MPLNNHEPVVYYLSSPEFSKVVKIGTTVNLDSRLKRMKRLKPDWDLHYLASEPGNETTEKQRMATFQHLRIAGDWFYLCDELEAHVATLGGAK